MNVFIYYLSDSKGNIRYVGKTKNEPRKRLYKHILECKSEERSHKINWIKSLLSKGERPIIEVIDEVPEEEWQFWEEYWISQLKSWGFQLTNLTIGGDGGNGYKHTSDSKKKMRRSKIGTKLPDEQKNKISQSIKDRYVEYPNYNRSGNNLKKLIDRELLYNLYIVDNLSLNKISNKLGFSKKKIFTSLKEYNISKPKESWVGQLSTQPKKIVLQYDLSNNFIKEYHGIPDIGIHKSNIANCCRGISKSAGGFIWKYKE